MSEVGAGAALACASESLGSVTCQQPWQLGYWGRQVGACLWLAQLDAHRHQPGAGCLWGSPAHTRGARASCPAAAVRPAHSCRAREAAAGMDPTNPPARQRAWLLARLGPEPTRRSRPTMWQQPARTRASRWWCTPAMCAACTLSSRWPAPPTARAAPRCAHRLPGIACMRMSHPRASVPVAALGHTLEACSHRWLTHLRSAARSASALSASPPCARSGAMAGAQWTTATRTQETGGWRWIQDLLGDGDGRAQVAAWRYCCCKLRLPSARCSSKPQCGRCVIRWYMYGGCPACSAQVPSSNMCAHSWPTAWLCPPPPSPAGPTCRRGALSSAAAARGSRDNGREGPAWARRARRRRPQQQRAPARGRYIFGMPSFALTARMMRSMMRSARSNMRMGRLVRDARWWLGRRRRLRRALLRTCATSQSSLTR